MKFYKVVSIVIMFVLFSCDNRGKMTVFNNTDSIQIESVVKDSVLQEGKEIATIKYDYMYHFTNDSVNQTLYIKKGALNKVYEVPEEIMFKLILNNKFNKYESEEFEGVAVLKNANESFYDKEINADYFAADYFFTLSGCSLNLRLDIVEFKACVASTTCNTLKYFLRTYPDYDIMKLVQ